MPPPLKVPRGAKPTRKSTDPPGENAYPIVTFTWMIVREEYKTERQAEVVKKVLNYCVGEGQKLSPKLGYIPLPPEVVDRVKQAIERIKH